jgi:hypothetical protein
MLGWFTALALAWVPQTDTVGGTGQLGSGNESYKLNVYAVRDQAVRLDEIEVYLQRQSDAAEVDYVVYRQAANGDWALVWDSGPIAVPSSNPGFKASPAPNLTLDAHSSYAIGVWFGADTFSYVYDYTGTEDVGWARVSDVVWDFSGEAPTLPDPITAPSGGTHRYNQRITVSFPEDLDGDRADELTDCDDAAPTVFPGADEVCNGVDDDCDGTVDDGAAGRWFTDADGDGFGDPDTLVETCEPPSGAVEDGRDCDDGDAEVFPGADEVCDGIDDDCDGKMGALEGDSDGDGSLDCHDCAPDDATIAPGLDEVCGDGVDHDCDGKVLDPQTCDEVSAEDLVAAGGGCGCDGAGPGGWVALVALAALRRRAPPR